MKLFENCLCLTQYLRWDNHIAESGQSHRLKGFLWKKVPRMEMWVKSDYLRVFLCLLQPISRPILFPLFLNKQPISLARSHNWLSLLSRNCCAFPLCPLWRDSIHLSAKNSSFTFSWQIIWPWENWEWDEDCLFCVRTTKWPAALARLLRSLRINYYKTAAMWEGFLRLLLESNLPFLCIY